MEPYTIVTAAYNAIARRLQESSKKVYYEQYQLREDFAMVTADSEAPAAAAAAKAGRRLRGRGRA